MPHVLQMPHPSHIRQHLAAHNVVGWWPVAKSKFPEPYASTPYKYLNDGLGFIVFYAIFDNISVIFWRSVFLVEETRVPRENHRLVASNWSTLSHNVVSSAPHLSGVQTHNFSGDRHWLIVKVVVNPTTIRSWRPLFEWSIQGQQIQCTWFSTSYK